MALVSWEGMSSVHTVLYLAARAAHELSVGEDGSFGGVLEAGQHLEGGGLARPVHAE